MGSGIIDDQHTDLSASVSHVGSAWLLATILVTLLFTVVAPFLNV